MHKNLVIAIKALVITLALMVLLYQLTLLAQCLRLSELPLQNAAGTLSVAAFVSLVSITVAYRPELGHSDTADPPSSSLFKPTSRIEKYFAPLLEMLVATALINLTSIFLNKDDVVEPFASSLKLVEAGQTTLFGAAALTAWILRRRRIQKQLGSDARSGRDAVSDISGGNTASLKDAAMKTPHSAYAPTY